MLPKENRLRNTKEIELVFRKGRGFRRGFLFLKFVKNNLKVSRFAFIVSRGVAKKAVQRNQIKRRLREAVSAKIPHIKTGLDFVFVAQKGMEGRGFQETVKDIEIIFNNLKLWNL